MISPPFYKLITMKSIRCIGFFGAKGVDFMNTRPDRKGPHRANFERNKQRILKTQNTCGICGKPVDKSLKAPNPLAPCIDHIIPVSKGGHPSDISNLQLAHWTCNRQKSDKLFKEKTIKEQQVLGNRNLPHSVDWLNYKSKF